MRSISIALLLTATGCHDCPSPDDEPDDSSSSSGSSSDGESESSTGEVDCVTPLHVCWDSDVDFDVCLDAYFACDPDAEEAYEACTGQVSTCIWNCCPYEVGAPGWSNNCGSGAENYEAVEACIDDCGLNADCLP